ncbi:MAG TPA: phosphatidate cytidylyltransferase [Sphingomicrobium sp.]|nr:phosphatidate cytidylyltransferase [Sphingomicrobium sp.]
MNELAVRSLTGLILIVAALLVAFQGGYLLALVVAAIATAMFYEWTRLTRRWGAAWYLGGFIYSLLPALALLWIRERAGINLLLWVFIVTWSTDIGAYFAGRALGRRKLAPTISPGKTIEGLLGGIAAATLLGGAFVLATGLGRWLLLFAPVLAVAAQAGDLFESAMKRRAGVKDSGAWLPGHGGVLDRLDGLVPVAVLTAAIQLLGLA